MQTVSDAVKMQIGTAANIDFAIGALARVLGLPAETPILIFTLGRTAGWLARRSNSKTRAG